MAWRPYENLIEGELDNTILGKVTGWIRFVGMEETVGLDLKGDFHRDIRGAKIRLRNPNAADSHQSGSPGEVQKGSYMDGFSPIRTGASSMTPTPAVKAKARVRRWITIHATPTASHTC